jgi:hypothetical protein
MGSIEKTFDELLAASCWPLAKTPTSRVIAVIGGKILPLMTLIRKIQSVFDQWDQCY